MTINKKLTNEILTAIPDAIPTLPNKYAAPISLIPSPPIDGNEAATQINGTKIRK